MHLPNEEIILCLDFLYNAQKERGFAALFLCCRGKQGGEEMHAQFAATDASIAKLQEPLRASGINCEQLFRSAQALPTLRQNIVAQHVWAFDVIEQYTQALVVPAIGIVNDLAIRNPRNMPERVTALIYLLHWQERLAREREMVSQLAGQEWMHDDAFVSRLKNIIRERQAYERMFWGTADEKQRQACAALKTALAEGRAEAARTGNQSGKFSFFNSRIAALHETALRMAGQLIGENLSIETAGSLSAPLLDTDIEAQYDNISSLPIFRGVGKETLLKLLQQARIVHYEKNNVFITQGEIGGRFYVILDGLVKTYKSVPDGDELIIQILGKRENVQEHDVLQPTPSPISAKAISRVKMLSIPSSVMRDFTIKNKNLALNLLTVTLRRSQKLINHFEQLTLRSALERVGYFLLNLNLETGIGVKSIILPFDKSLIASYLGIKPETFSRVLQELRGLGFSIEKQHITLPEPYALCDYCDIDTAQKCDLAETTSCPRLEMHEVKTG